MKELYFSCFIFLSGFLYFATASSSIISQDFYKIRKKSGVIPGKVDKLVQSKKSHISRVHKVRRVKTPLPLIQTPKSLESEVQAKAPSSWAELSSSLGEGEIKSFLNTLPLDVLRNLTALSRQDPKIGESKLLELYIAKEKSLKKNKKDEEEVVLYSENELELEAPKYASILPHPKSMNIFEQESSKQFTNSGYFLPELTTDRPSQIGNGLEPEEAKPKRPNPENTFNPNPEVDNYLSPPEYPTSFHLQHDRDLQQNEYEYAKPWNNRNREQLVPAASNNINEGYSYYDSQPAPIEISNQQSKIPNEYEYQHTTIKQQPPIRSHAVTVIDGNEGYGSYKPNSEFTENANNNNNIPVEHPVNNDGDDQHNKYQQHFGGEKPPSLAHEYSGWGPPPSSGDWGPSEIWNKLKTYMKKGDKTTTQKIFEVSISILSFLAFSGYLVMLIYQMFAVATRVPLFPLFSPVIPPNPTIFGLLFGRSLVTKEEDGSYRFFPWEGFSDKKYIDEVESIVKTAMGRVKEEWGSLNLLDGN